MDTQELNRQNFESSVGDHTPEAGGCEAQGRGECLAPAPVVENVNPSATNCVEAHGDYLFNFAVGQMRDTNIAEDLVQETFLAAPKSQNTLSGRSSERTWLVGILRHKICEHLRRAFPERALRVHPSPAHEERDAFDESLLWIDQTAAESTSPSRRIELGEFREHLEKAMSKLSPRIAQVFQLYSVEECANREVCSRLNISENNLWVMLHRACQQSSEALAGWRNLAQSRQQKGVAAHKSLGARG